MPADRTANERGMIGYLGEFGAASPQGWQRENGAAWWISAAIQISGRRKHRPMTASDEEILSALRAGDVDAMAQYLERHRRPLLAFIERRIGDALRRKVEAEDILQETSADAIRSLSQMDLSEREPFSWLCQVAERRIIDAHRKYVDAQKRSANRETPLQGGNADGNNLIDLLVLTMTTQSQAFSRNVKQQRLAEALSQLPEDQQKALRLRYVDGLPSKQIAVALEKSDAAVRVMLTRSLKRLQEILDPR